MLVVRCRRCAIGECTVAGTELAALTWARFAGKAVSGNEGCRQLQAKGISPDTNLAPTDQAWLLSEGVRWMTPMAADAGLCPSLAQCL